MKKYFIVSDIHSFYTPFIIELVDNERSGFDINNPNHILVVLGDVFDRGFETIELYNFLMKIPKERRIMIRGNHEQLYIELLSKEFPDGYDFSNGTVRTFCQIAGYDEKMLDRKYWYVKSIVEGRKINVPQMIQSTWLRIRSAVKQSEITEWIKSDEWVNYFELKDYICVHSWIPTQQRLVDNYYVEEIGYRDDWRNATQTEWNDATWGCPWSKAFSGWNKTGKTIVCGHWHTSDFFNHLGGKHKKHGVYDCPIFKSKKYKVIAIDACTVGSNKTNILVVEE